MKKFTRTEPEFVGGPVVCEFPDDVNVQALLDNGWVLAGKANDKPTEKPVEKTEKVEPAVAEEKVETVKAKKPNKTESMF